MLRTTAFASVVGCSRCPAHTPLHFAPHSCIGNRPNHCARCGAVAPTLPPTLVTACLHGAPSHRPAIAVALASSLPGFLTTVIPAASPMPASSSVFGKNTRFSRAYARFSRAYTADKRALAYPYVLSTMTPGRRTAVSTIAPFRRPGRCRSSAAQANPLMRHGFHTQSPVHRSLLSDRPSRAWAPNPTHRLCWGAIEPYVLPFRGHSGSNGVRRLLERVYSPENSGQRIGIACVFPPRFSGEPLKMRENSLENRPFRRAVLSRNAQFFQINIPRTRQDPNSIDDIAKWRECFLCLRFGECSLRLRLKARAHLQSREGQAVAANCEAYARCMGS